MTNQKTMKTLKLVEAVIVLPQKGNTVKITEENFLALLTENKMLRLKNSELNKLILKLTNERKT